MNMFSIFAQWRKAGYKSNDIQRTQRVVIISVVWLLTRNILGPASAAVGVVPRLQQPHAGGVQGAERGGRAESGASRCE